MNNDGNEPRLKLFEEWQRDEKDREWLDPYIAGVAAIGSLSELEEWVMKATSGYMMPLNPVEPLRSVLREKIMELSEGKKLVGYLSGLLPRLEGDRQEIVLPPGAVY